MPTVRTMVLNAWMMVLNVTDMFYGKRRVPTMMNTFHESTRAPEVTNKFQEKVSTVTNM
jgi:hypothetical protein